MVKFESILAPMFDGSNYVIWCSRMEVYLSTLGYDIWKSVINGYFVSASPPIDPKAKIRYECNAKSMKAILNWLSNTVSLKVYRCKSTKSLWDRLKKLYGEEPTITGLDYERKKIYEAIKFEADKCRPVSCCNEDKNESHLFMAQGTQDEERTSCCDSVS